MSPLTFVDSVLCGISQVMLQNNRYTGLLFLLGIFYNSTLLGLAALVGATVSTAVSLVLRLNASQIREGLFGFNGALVGVALLFFLQNNPMTWLQMILAAGASTILMTLALRIFATWKLPTLTSPFVFTTLGVLLLSSQRLSPMSQGPQSFFPVLEGLLNGVGQVFFQENIVTGVIFVVALLISSRQACVLALFGSFTGILMAKGLGVSDAAIGTGVFGFNPVLTAIAMGGFFSVWNASAAGYVLVATLATPIMTMATSKALAPLGLPTLTLPFVLTVWIFKTIYGVMSSRSISNH